MRCLTWPLLSRTRSRFRSRSLAFFLSRSLAFFLSHREDNIERRPVYLAVKYLGIYKYSCIVKILLVVGTCGPVFCHKFFGPVCLRLLGFGQTGYQQQYRF